MAFSSIRTLALLVAAALVAGGCSPMTATVTGTVNLDGEPLRIGKSQRGTVLFRPVAGGATATGLIDENGKYSLSTGATSALAPGDYLVAVRATEITAASEEMPAPEGTPITPLIYANPMESGLSFTVKSGPNTFDIDLRSDAGPFTAPLETEEAAPGDEPAVDVDAAAGDDAATDDGGPATDDPAADDPATDDTATDDPATDDPATDDTATDDTAPEVDTESPNPATSDGNDDSGS